MDRISDIQIVLHTTKFSENSVIVHVLSRRMGRRSFISGSAGRQGARLLPLSINEVSVTPNPKSTLYRESNIQPLYSLSGLRGDLFKNAITLFLSEVLFKVLPEDVVDEELFDWCRSEILRLDAAPAEDVANFHLNFLIGLAGHLGFATDAEHLLPFSVSDVPSVSSGTARRETAQALINYISFHSGRTVNIRSLDVLSDLFK